MLIKFQTLQLRQHSRIGVPFSKFHGAGNDFVLIDNREDQYSLDSTTFQRMCHRRFGIGADGVIVIKSSDVADFKMACYGPDGSNGTLCGNATRCALDFARKIGLKPSTVCGKSNSQEESVNKNGVGIDGKTMAVGGIPYEMKTNSSQVEDERAISKYPHFVFEAYDGLHEGGIAKSMISDSGDVIDEYYVTMKDVALDDIVVYENGDLFLDTGSPHHVIFLTSCIDDLDVMKKGRELRYGLYSEKGSSINFVHRRERSGTASKYSHAVTDIGQNMTSKDMSFQHRSRRKLDENDDKSGSTSNASNDESEIPTDKEEGSVLLTRTYERCVEQETLACGTGAVAVAISDYVTALRGLSDSQRPAMSGGEDNAKALTKIEVPFDKDTFLKLKGVNEKQQRQNLPDSISASDFESCKETRTIKMPGGCLHVDFTVKILETPTLDKKIVFSNIQLSGPAEHVFSGVYRI